MSRNSSTGASSVKVVPPTIDEIETVCEQQKELMRVLLDMACELNGTGAGRVVTLTSLAKNLSESAHRMVVAYREEVAK
ncbi:hypothetical protein [Herbaspirillum rubrisubalbicans]|uniref:Uncharacterized protein n=1 Tax=Herbaspirillum rubrisubalbicans TaxID=80842 RepID=A0AAD0XF16_9BURK|nr:hypothetical protein [Herbaspirillum rubrisubalbicans]AYR23002.1 hypothetical protein RC54_03835 [Herbaspirillum rubrisubalbicans]